MSQGNSNFVSSASQRPFSPDVNTIGKVRVERLIATGSDLASERQCYDIR